jgi:hypothetical protein
MSDKNRQTDRNSERESLTGRVERQRHENRDLDGDT